MVKLKSFDEYKSAVKRAKAVGGTISNCFLMPAAIKNMIAGDRLYLIENEAGCLLLQKEDSFYRGYYYLSAEHEPPKPELDMPAVIELVFQNELTPKQRTEIELVEKMGFVLGRESNRMVLSAENVMPLYSAEKVRRAVPGEEKVIGKLFAETFNPLYSFLPSDEELSQAVAEGRVYAVFSEKNLCAALYAQVEKQTATLRLLAVSPDYRRGGLGGQLVRFYHDALADSVNTFNHWVDLNNTGAVCLYRKFGYTFDSRKANEYVL